MIERMRLPVSRWDQEVSWAPTYRTDYQQEKLLARQTTILRAYYYRPPGTPWTWRSRVSPSLANENSTYAIRSPRKSGLRTVVGGWSAEYGKSDLPSWERQYGCLATSPVLSDLTLSRTYTTSGTRPPIDLVLHVSAGIRRSPPRPQLALIISQHIPLMVAPASWSGIPCPCWSILSPTGRHRLAGRKISVSCTCIILCTWSLLSIRGNSHTSPVQPYVRFGVQAVLDTENEEEDITGADQGRRDEDTEYCFYLWSAFLVSLSIDNQSSFISRLLWYKISYQDAIDRM